MAKTLIITVAGCASRFNKDLDKPTLKCLYFEENERYSLLYQILDKARDFDHFIIVGGYLFDDLKTYCQKYLTEFNDRISLIFNPHFQDYGSGWSLLMGLEAITTDNCEEIVFVEGDLFFDCESFNNICKTAGDVITYNSEPILASKAVALYIDTDTSPHYLYDLSHGQLCIPEPFTAVLNSAQIWKFSDSKRLFAVIKSLNDQQKQGTNLEIIQKYFGPLKNDAYTALPVQTWFNCNTVADYQQTLKLMK